VRQVLQYLYIKSRTIYINRRPQVGQRDKSSRKRIYKSSAFKLLINVGNVASLKFACILTHFLLCVLIQKTGVFTLFPIRKLIVLLAVVVESTVHSLEHTKLSNGLCHSAPLRRIHQNVQSMLI